MKILNYKKQLIMIAILLIVIIVASGIYILHTTLNNIKYSRSDAHAIALNAFEGTITNSTIEYNDLQMVYEITIKNQEQEVIEVEINAKTGRIIGFEYKE